MLKVLEKKSIIKTELYMSTTRKASKPEKPAYARSKSEKWIVIATASTSKVARQQEKIASLYWSHHL